MFLSGYIIRNRRYRRHAIDAKNRGPAKPAKGQRDQPVERMGEDSPGFVLISITRLFTRLSTPRPLLTVTVCVFVCFENDIKTVLERFWRSVCVKLRFADGKENQGLKPHRVLCVCC